MHTKHTPTALVLASTSRYRAELLGRLGLSFTSAAPQVDEAHRSNEPPATRAIRLAREKSVALAAQFPGAVLIGSDQVAALEGSIEGTIEGTIEGSIEDTMDGPMNGSMNGSMKASPEQLFDKPGTESNAIETLMSVRGKTVNFHTALCLHHPASDTSIEHTDITAVDVRMDLDEETITRYVKADNPLDCAGAFKVEALGIALFTAVRSEDPTALMGLPLIATANGLRSFGYQVP